MNLTWAETISLVFFAYMMVDFSIGMYFKTKYQGPYSDGMVRMVTLIPLLTIPSIVVCKIYGWDHIKKIPEGVYKTSWENYRAVRKEKGMD